MKFYSEVTKQLYDTAEALSEAEAKRAAEITEKKAREEAEAKKKAARAAEVETAMNESLEAAKIATEKQNHYVELRNAFIKDYGSWHMTVSDKDVKQKSSTINDLFDFLFRY